MRLASPTTDFPRPAALPKLAVTPAIDLATDVVELDGAGSKQLPQAIADGGIQLDIDTTTLDYEGEPITDWYASDSEYDNAYRMKREGFTTALAAAQLIAKGHGHEAVAVVQGAKNGARYIVPLGVWDPRDESQLSFEDVGGTPYWASRRDQMHMKNSGTADVAAVVFSDGEGWVNLTGHPVRLPHEG
jgi:hypothetical protein